VLELAVVGQGFWQGLTTSGNQNERVDRVHQLLNDLLITQDAQQRENLLTEPRSTVSATRCCGQFSRWGLISKLTR
jgi:hypothetical protein